MSAAGGYAAAAMVHRGKLFAIALALALALGAGAAALASGDGGGLADAAALASGGGGATAAASGGAGGAAAGAVDDRARPGDGRGGFRLGRVGRFDEPVYVTGPAGAGGRLFVVEQGGRIKVVSRRGKPRTFLRVKGVQSGGERGLLSVAFAPGYRSSGLLYVYFTERGGDIVVREYRRARGHRYRARGRSGRKVIEIEHSEYPNHNGGQLQFGPDGFLYIGTGDGGSAYDPHENAQNRGSLLGKLLRIDPRRDGDARYSVPGSNPFVGRDGRDEIYAYGLRNPFRFSFDRADGNLLIGDVGQDRYEEIDYVTLDGARGANFGWDAFEGTHPLNDDPSPDPGGTLKPIHEYSHAGGNCAITGGYVSRDRRIRSLFGRYLYADFCKGQIRSLVANPGGASGDRPTGLPVRSGVSSFGEDSRGRIYVANRSSGVVSVIRPKRRR